MKYYFEVNFRDYLSFGRSYEQVKLVALYLVVIRLLYAAGAYVLFSEPISDHSLRSCSFGLCDREVQAQW